MSAHSRKNAGVSRTKTTTIKFNATGRHTLLQILDRNDAAHEKIADAGIMEEVTFTEEQVEQLVAVVEEADAGGVHWMNTKARIRGAAKRMGVV